LSNYQSNIANLSFKFKR